MRARGDVLLVAVTKLDCFALLKLKDMRPVTSCMVKVELVLEGLDTEPGEWLLARAKNSPELPGLMVFADHLEQPEHTTDSTQWVELTVESERIV